MGGRDYGASPLDPPSSGADRGGPATNLSRVAASVQQRPSLQSLLQLYMERVHAPALMNPIVQLVVICTFITGACV